MDIVEYAEKMIGIELFEYQKIMLRRLSNLSPDKKIYICMPHRCGSSIYLEHLEELSKIIFSKEKN